MNFDSKAYIKAKKRVKAKKGFFGHLAVFLATSIFFLVINLATFDGEFWFFYPMFGWGIGLLIHYFAVFGIPGVGRFDENWEEKEIIRELRRNQSDYKDLEEDDPLILRDLEKSKNRSYRNDEFV